MNVINQMLNAESQETTQHKVMNVGIEEIHPNPLNKAPMINIDELVAMIQEKGLQTPLQVYKKENHEYMLINGERRYRALKRIGASTVPVIVISKPENSTEERMLIMDANAQRDETPEYKHQRAKEYEDIYFELKNKNKIPVGLLKIDWIGIHMGVSGRTVQRYLDTTEEKKKKEKKVENLQIFTDLKEHMQRMLGSTVKFKKNSFTIPFQDVKDLNRILEILHLDDVFNE